MDLTTFIQKFGTERKCENYVKKHREKHGVFCPKCSCKTDNWREKQKYWRCSCGNKISLKAGTIMESSKLSLSTWFKCMFLMTHIKKSYSILELSRILGIRRYRTVWYLTMKLRVVMGDQVLAQEYFHFMYLISGNKSSEKNINGIQNYSMCGIIKTDRRKRDEINIVLPLQLLHNVEVEENRLKDKGYRCVKVFEVMKKIELKEAYFPVKPEVKKWMDTVMANANRLLNGVHHGVSYLHLQLYQLEYSFNYNLRYKNKFEVLKTMVLV